LQIDASNSYLVNLGNDRPNITPSVIQIRSKKDYEALLNLIASGVMSPDDLVKTIIFTNLIPQTHEILRFLHQHMPITCTTYIQNFHALRSSCSKQRVLNDFVHSRVRILIATEAAGMGADIPDIELVIQFCIPSSLEVWAQRAGRAGRSPNIQARAVLLAESLLLWKEATVNQHLREWLQTTGCRHDASDIYFGNTAVQQAPTGKCCDWCEGVIEAPERTQTPVNERISSVHSTPTKSRNSNRKRTMSTSDDTTAPTDVNPSRKAQGPAVHRGEHLKQARVALTQWRSKTKLEHYSPSSFTSAAILPDTYLTTLASNARLQMVADIAGTLKSPWMLLERHG
ncbi:P-loop containing nucleoside triphosphate hydrolase protein, partial [Leucogyrophana mollusca]